MSEARVGFADWAVDGDLPPPTARILWEKADKFSQENNLCSIVLSAGSYLRKGR